MLVVDDSEICCEFVRLALEDHGFTVVTMCSPFGFVKMLREEQPDLVMVDVSMGTLSGPKLVELALQKRACPSPIVLYSARPETELAKLARSCGADGYIEKTSDEAKLRRAVDRYLVNPIVR